MHKQRKGGVMAAVEKDVAEAGRVDGPPSGEVASEDQRLRTQLGIMTAVAVASNESEVLGDALQRTVDATCRILGWDAGHAWLPDEDRPGTLASSGIWSVPAGSFSVLQQATEGLTVDEGSGLPGFVLTAGEPVWIDDVDGKPWFVRGRAGQLDVHAAMAIPVYSRDKVVAVLEFFNRQRLPRDDQLLNVMAHAGTQLGRVHERAEALAAEQRAIDTERRFLSMLTHELRSPLISIKGFVDLLLQRWVELPDDERFTFLERVGTSADRLHRMVDEFLGLAKRHAEGFEPRLVELDVAERVADVTNELVLTHLDVRADVEPGLVAVGDADFFHQILVNLLTNADRYGEPPVEIHAGRIADRVQIAVTDHGPGVPDDFVDHLFKRFARADRGGDGTGLGLSIAQDLATAQHGRLHYEKGASGGARFVLTLSVPDG